MEFSCLNCLWKINEDFKPNLVGIQKKLDSWDSNELLLTGAEFLGTHVYGKKKMCTCTSSFNIGEIPDLYVKH